MTEAEVAIDEMIEQLATGETSDGESDKFQRFGTNYLYEALYMPAANLVKDYECIMEGVEHDTLIGTGLSGALVVPLLARGTRRHFAIIRKPGDGAHSLSQIEGCVGRRWVFVDDFISSGGTLDRVHETLMNNPSITDFTEFVGAYLYCYCEFRPANPDPNAVASRRVIPA